MVKKIEVTVKIAVEVPDDYDIFSVVDYLAWDLNCPGFEQFWGEVNDPSAVTVTGISYDPSQPETSVEQSRCEQGDHAQPIQLASGKWICMLCGQAQL